jgi:hypothetical protein
MQTLCDESSRADSIGIRAVKLLACYQETITNNLTVSSFAVHDVSELLTDLDKYFGRAVSYLAEKDLPCTVRSMLRFSVHEKRSCIFGFGLQQAW